MHIHVYVHAVLTDTHTLCAYHHVDDGLAHGQDKGGEEHDAVGVQELGGACEGVVQGHGQDHHWSDDGRHHTRVLGRIHRGNIIVIHVITVPYSLVFKRMRLFGKRQEICA